MTLITPSRPELSAARATAEFCRQPPSGQRETIARVLGLLVPSCGARRGPAASSRRRHGRRWPAYGITEADVRRTV